jgi:hypothetical protein
VEVTDPAEPLFGKRFEVVSISRGNPPSAHVFVKYQGDIVLRLPLRATSLSALAEHAPRAKLCQLAVQDFLSLVKEYELCPHKTPRRRAKSGTRSADKTNKQSFRSSNASSRR